MSSSAALTIVPRAPQNTEPTTSLETPTTGPTSETFEPITTSTTDSTAPESTPSSTSETSGEAAPSTTTSIATESTTSSNSDITGQTVTDSAESSTITPPNQTTGASSSPIEVPSSTSNPASNAEPGPTQSEGTGSTPPRRLSDGAIAGIVVVVILIALAVAGMYLVSRRKRKSASRKDESSGPPRMPSGAAVGSKGGYYGQDEENPKTATVPPVQFDAPLDDVGLVKLFDRLDDRISDHLVNFNLDENIGSPEFAEHLNSGGPKAAGEGIIYRGKGLLKREDSRLYMLRALFAYHVFGAIADQMIFTEEQHKWIHQAARGDRAVRVATICRQLETEDNFAHVVDFLYRHLESKTQIHVPRNMVASENRLASLREIAKGAALVTIRLGLQRDSFKLVFLFQSNRYAQARGKIPCETSAIKDFDLNPEHFEILGEAGSDCVVRAMVSPSVYRCPDGGQRYMVRRMKVFTTPPKSSKEQVTEKKK